jgi:hypothetical protein
MTLAGMPGFGIRERHEAKLAYADATVEFGESASDGKARVSRPRRSRVPRLPAKA